MMNKQQMIIVGLIAAGAGLYWYSKQSKTTVSGSGISSNSGASGGVLEGNVTTQAPGLDWGALLSAMGAQTGGLETQQGSKTPSATGGTAGGGVPVPGGGAFATAPPQTGGLESQNSSTGTSRANQLTAMGLVPLFAGSGDYVTPAEAAARPNMLAINRQNTQATANSNLFAGVQG